MIFYVFFGGMVAAVAAVILQFSFENYLTDGNIDKSGFYPITIFALVEEFFKFALTFMIIAKTKHFDEPVDAMIYMVTAAAGMAAVENVSIMVGDQAITEKTGILIFRFLGATLLHVLSSSLMGYYWAKGLINKNMLFWLPFGLIMASLFHGLFNYSIILFDSGVIYSIIFIVVAAFFIFYDFEKLKNLNIKINSGE